MGAPELRTVWRKSSYSANGGTCVEVGFQLRGVLVRDTKDRAGGTLSFGSAEWRMFLTECVPAR
ncbi:DUF397 domain-containing protein [Amycolatopsis nigrescens]|uniref:DUF397 domain-containing protein n=1 Tax=Amycolatopsis nigrescens TaxID=381445 RepID=UPI00037FBBB3|nr:DUF397 domain-containing protein [Amycolatopsis nigrescens]